MGDLYVARHLRILGVLFLLSTGTIYACSCDGTRSYFDYPTHIQSPLVHVRVGERIERDSNEYISLEVIESFTLGFVQDEIGYITSLVHSCQTLLDRVSLGDEIILIVSWDSEQDGWYRSGCAPLPLTVVNNVVTGKITGDGTLSMSMDSFRGQIS